MRRLRLNLFLAVLVVGAGGDVLSPSARADLLVGSNKNSMILRFDDKTGAFLGPFVPSGSGGLVNPGGLAIGPDHNLYVASNGTNQVLRYDGGTGAFLGVFASGGGLDKPSGIVFGPDGNLYVNSHGSGPNPLSQVLRFDGQTGAFLGVFASDPRLDQISTGLVFGPDGNLYVNNHLGNAVFRFDGKTGAFLDIFASGHGLVQPSGLAFGPDGNLYVAAHDPSAGHGKVYRFNGQTGEFIDLFIPDAFPDPLGLRNPTEMLFLPDGTLLIDSRANSSVLRFDAATGQFIDTFIPRGTGGLNAPNSLLLFTPIPEPSTFLLLGAALLGTAGYAWRRRRRTPASRFVQTAG
jgi:DNA-binding beta-propeller fold protein YncE